MSGEQKSTTIDSQEFIRRFCCTFCPEGSSRFATLVFSPTGCENGPWHCVARSLKRSSRLPHPISHLGANAAQPAESESCESSFFCPQPKSKWLRRNAPSTRHDHAAKFRYEDPGVQAVAEVSLRSVLINAVLAHADFTAPGNTQNQPAFLAQRQSPQTHHASFAPFNPLLIR